MICPFERDIPRYPGEPRNEALPTKEDTVFNQPMVAISSEFIAQYMSSTANSKERSATMRNILQFCSENKARNTLLGVVDALMHHIRSGPEDEQGKLRLQSYQNLFKRVKSAAPNSIGKAPIVQKNAEFREGESSETSDIDRIHRMMFEKARNELGLNPAIPCPFLWYLEPGEIGELERDIQLQTGYSLDPALKRNLQTLLTDKERVGLTLNINAPTGDVIFPGIILSKNWPNIISDPDRILLQENINSLIIRSSTIYQMGANVAFLRTVFGDYAFNVRDLLAYFTEEVGTETTEIFSKKLGIRGHYLKKHEYSVDVSGKAVVGTSSDATKIHDDLLKASPSRILSELLNKGKFNPATEATLLLAAWLDEIAQATPAHTNLIQGMKNRIMEANRIFADAGIKTLTKNSNGEWVRTSTRRLIK